MGGGGPVTIDLDALALKGGEAARLDVRLRPEPPVLGGEKLPLKGDDVEVRVDVSRTSSGFALRLRTETVVTGDCARCLGPAELAVSIDAREVDQPSTDDPEMRSPYVHEGLLDVDSWLHDAVRLAIPEQILCKPECAGLCEVCGANLNDFAPGEHRHEPKLDPRFAKLRELSE
jgi:uncharacterized protein